MSFICMTIKESYSISMLPIMQGVLTFGEQEASAEQILLRPNS